MAIDYTLTDEQLKQQYDPNKRFSHLSGTQLRQGIEQYQAAGTPAGGFNIDFNKPLEIRYPTTQTDEYGNILKERSQKTVDPMAIQEEERNRIQAQIDALENYWSQTILPELQTEATDRLGQSRGLQAAGGLLESPRGVAMTRQTQNLNTRVQRAERAKIDQQIAGLYAKADERAIDRADKEATLLRQDQDAYYQYLKENQAQTRDDLVTLFSAGISPDELKAQDPERYKMLLEQSGTDEFMADALYNINAPRQQQIDYQYAWKGNNLVAYGQDPTTGELISNTYSADDLGLPTGINLETYVDKATNMVYWYDKDNPEIDENGSLIMKPVKSPTGSNVMGASSSGGTSGGFTSQEKRRLEQAGLENASRQEQLDFLYGETGSDWDKARTLLEENKNISPEQQKIMLREKTELSDSDINILVEESQPEPTIEDLTADIKAGIDAGYSKADLEKKYLEAGWSPNEFKQAWDNSTTSFWERVSSLIGK